MKPPKANPDGTITIDKDWLTEFLELNAESICSACGVEVTKDGRCSWACPWDQLERAHLEATK